MAAQTTSRRRTRLAKSRGSALLVTLMIMAGLSLLGLVFVAVSETESIISVNARNYAQTHAVAEAGARVVLEWFQDPIWARDHNLMPVNANAIKTLRKVTVSGSYGEDYYKPIGLLCDKPFKGSRINRFYGDESHPDIIINATTNATFLEDFNEALMNDTVAGQVTDIRVYAPPMVGATLNTHGFYEGGTRYGVATIRVTAARFDVNGNRLAERWVKLVVSEWPFPGPQGPVQSNANISTAGNFGVHWGRMTSDGTMTIKRPLIGLPWFDAWDSLHYENGYFGETPALNSNGETLPRPGVPFQNQHPWLWKLYGTNLQDPWYEARARGEITNATGAGNTAAHPYKFSNLAQDVTATPLAGYSNWFQYQDHDDGPPGDFKQVLFPRIDYEFWKNISQAASSMNTTVYYLRWVSGENYTNGVETKSFAEWTNAGRGTNPAKPGFYFFDTRNGLNPQGAGAPGVLAPPIDVNSSDDGAVYVMKGFVYLNTEQFGTTGIRGPGDWFNFPGEPFRDVGYREALADGTAFTGQPPIKAGNGVWDYQEMNGNGRVDVFLESKTVEWPPSSGTTRTLWFPKAWFPNCVPGFNGVAGANCSEPHEPYLNLIYPDTACCGGGGDPTPMRVGWEDPASFTRRPIKKHTTTGQPIPCDLGLNPPDPDCTHNGRNESGPLVENFGTAPNTKPILDGILYNEGNFDTAGNAAYFGSILIQGSIVGNGTPEVWFDECLIRGCWQDKFKELPRVYVTSVETDQ